MRSQPFKNRSWSTIVAIVATLFIAGNLLGNPTGDVIAQKGSVGRNALHLLPTSSEWKGLRGEVNVYPALKSLGKDMGYELEERYVSHRVLQHGIDAIYREVKTKRFNVIEAKATTKTGRLSLGLLDIRVGGERQMEGKWVRKKLDEAYKASRTILEDSSAPAAKRLSARRTIQMVDDIHALKLRNAERTLVITRLSGVDPVLSGGATLSDELLDFFDHVIEVQRSGRVIRVHR